MRAQLFEVAVGSPRFIQEFESKRILAYDSGEAMVKLHSDLWTVLILVRRESESTMGNLILVIVTSMLLQCLPSNTHLWLVPWELIDSWKHCISNLIMSHSTCQILDRD